MTGRAEKVKCSSAIQRLSFEMRTYNFSLSTGTSTTCSNPSYFGRSSPYFSATLGLKNRPPRKWLPLNHLISGFGAVRLISAGGMKPLPGPSCRGPSSISQEDGASTASTGILVDASASMTLGKGSRTSPLNEKPKIASIMWSVFCRALAKSSVKGTCRSSSCFLRRYNYEYYIHPL